MVYTLGIDVYNSVFFLGVKIKKSPVKNFGILGVKNKSAREKPQKSTRENHFLPVKIFENFHP